MLYCMGGSSPSPAPATVPAPAAPATVEEVLAPDIGMTDAEKKKKAQAGKRDLRVDVGALDPTSVGAGITSGINLA